MYIHTMEYYSVIKRNDLSSHGKTWRNLTYMLLSERSQYENVQLKIKKVLQKTTQSKNKQKTCIDISPKKTYRRPIGT